MTIQIAAAVSPDYVDPLCVMLASLVRHLAPGERAHLHLVHHTLDAGAIGRVSALVDTTAVALTPVHMAMAVSSPRYPAITSVPILLAHVLPVSVERVLYLDADLLVLDDIGPLWRTPLAGRVLAAAPDQAVLRCGASHGVKGCARWGVPPGAPYLNAGVMLMDLAQWRARDVTARVRAYMQETGDRVEFLHQEGVNAVLWDAWQPVDVRWNCLAHRPVPGMAIAHFAGRVKPWRARAGGAVGRRYREALRALGIDEVGSRRDRLVALYDRTLRPVLYPIEHFLWEARLT